MNYEPGMLARSRAGHDKGSIYVIISVKNEYVYLADGDSRPLRRMKRKNRKHLQPILKSEAGCPENDDEIRKIIRNVKMKSSEGETP